MDTVPVPPPPALAPPPPGGAPRRSLFLATALGWALPGGGQFYVGRPGKGLLMFLAIGALFYGGLALSGFTCVNPSTYDLEFVAHAFLGGPTAAALHFTGDVHLTEPMPWFETGRLYAAVAGLLNVVAVCDALGSVIEHNRRSWTQDALRQAWYEVQQREGEEQQAAQGRPPADPPPSAGPEPGQDPDPPLTAGEVP